MYRSSFIPMVLFFAAGITLFPKTAAAIENPAVLPIDISGMELSIRYFDKRIYYPESEIALKITIANRSPFTCRFKLAEDRIYSLSFDATTPTNRILDAADDYKRALSTTRPVFYREIAVEPGEEYSFVENLKRFVRITDPGSYTVNAVFWPELAPIRAKSETSLVDQASSSESLSQRSLSSNSLILSIRPSPGLPPVKESIRLETGEILKPQVIAPDEVVRRTIIARQRSRWNEYYLYLDLESLLMRDEDRKRSYNRESDEGRRRMMEKYKTDLRESIVDEDIVLIPESFEILETRYSSGFGHVRVLEKFAHANYIIRKEYDYELKQKDDIWYIVGYSVINKGTE